MMLTSEPATAEIRRTTQKTPNLRAPDVVIWEADGSPYGRLGYGHAIAARLTNRGLTVTTVPLTHRRPSALELATAVHIISGGATSVGSYRRWVRSTRRSFEPVLSRALEGHAAITGICFGAQLIASMLAGSAAVAPNPPGIEAGLTQVWQPGGGPISMVSQLHYHPIQHAAVAAMGGDVVLTNDHTTVQAFTVGPTIVGLPCACFPKVGPERRRDLDVATSIPVLEAPTMSTADDDRYRARG